MKVHYYKAILTPQEAANSEPCKVVNFKDPVSMLHSGKQIMEDPEKGFETVLTYGGDDKPGLYYSKQNRKQEFVAQSYDELIAGDIK